MAFYILFLMLTKGFLVCELVHRMTNNRIYGWDYDGNELPNEILNRYFKNDILNLVTIIDNKK